MNAQVTLDLRIDDAGWHRVDDCKTLVSKSLKTALESAGEDRTSVSATVILADNKAVQELNSHWRSKNKPTNILSFPAPQDERDEAGGDYLGDMILAFDVVAREAATQRKPLATHLCHLIIHGTLHLLGFDHVEDSDAQQMEQLEKTAMAKLGYRDPYGETTAVAGFIDSQAK